MLTVLRAALHERLPPSSTYLGLDEPEQWRHLRFARCALTRVEMADDEAQQRE